MMAPIGLALLLAALTSAEDPLVVKTTGGLVRGLQAASRAGQRFLAFTGIPFAKPPVGALRFMPPEEAAPWSGVINSTDQRPACVQYDSYYTNGTVIGQEDCLYLSVFTHNTKGKAPVMVHIHGGGFFGGYGLNSEKVFMMMDQDIVLVDIQYRLGIMGFLSFEDRVVPGNQGLKDQTMALRWVKKNIADFGGDPELVTIAGWSAGAASVCHHTVSPLSAGLFHRAIAESGASYNQWAVMPPGLVRKNSLRLADMVLCNRRSTKDIADCLRNKKAAELVGHMPQFQEWLIFPTEVFMPVLEPPGPGSFLTAPIGHWKHSPVPLLIGMTSAEGLYITEPFISRHIDFEWYNDNFDKVAPLSLTYFASASNPAEVTRKVRQFYFGGKPITAADWVNITNMHTDGCFTAGVFEQAALHPAPVFFYYFEYMGRRHEVNLDSKYIFGASHVDEGIYLWWGKSRPNLEGSDLEFSKKLVKIWADFAKYGKGTPPLRSTKWETWSSKRHRYLRISNSGFSAEEGLLEERSRFWRTLNFRDLQIQ